jgi:hypothetical protein
MLLRLQRPLMVDCLSISCITAENGIHQNTTHALCEAFFVNKVTVL